MPVQLFLFVQLVQLVLFVQLVLLVQLFLLVQLVPLAKAHKNADFVLEMSENRGSGPQKRTKSKRLRDYVSSV